MSVHLSSVVWRESTATGTTLLVLLSLADQANDDGECWPSVAKIAQRCRVSERSVHRHLNDLEELGEIGRRERPGQPSIYTINLRQLDTPRVSQSGTGANLAPLTQVSGGYDTGVRGGMTLLADKASVNHQEPSYSSDNPREDVDRLCEHLAGRIEGNGSKRPKITKTWRDAARHLIDIDHRTEQQIHAAIDWCQDHDFWRANILSMPKLRAKYDQIRLQATSKSTQRQPERALQPVPAYTAGPRMPDDVYKRLYGEEP